MPHEFLKEKACGIPFSQFPLQQPFCFVCKARLQDAVLIKNVTGVYDCTKVIILKQFTTYWKGDKMLKEFIAHASENYWGGNNLFKELCPDLYREMRKLMDKMR